MDLAHLQALLAPIALPESTHTIGTLKALEEATDDHVLLRFPFPVGHIIELLRQEVSKALQAAGLGQLHIRIESAVAVHQVQPNTQPLACVKNIVAVASGKGGVGKSTVSANLAVALARMGARVGVLDADLYGPSQQAMLGVAQLAPSPQPSGRLLPVRNADGVQLMSIGLLIDADQAVIWRGPMVSQALQQLLYQSAWDDVDYLIIDLPPGTGDVQLTLAQKIPVTAALVVTTPQDIALLDVRRAVSMFGKVHIPVVGIVENMSVHTCPSCGHTEAIFGEDGGAALAQQLDLPLLGRLPLLRAVREAADRGTIASLQESLPSLSEAYTSIAWQIVQSIATKGKDFSRRFPKIVVES